MAQSSPQFLPEKFPIGQRVSLPAHFLEPVTLEGIRFIGSGYGCRVRLADGDEPTWSKFGSANAKYRLVATPALLLVSEGCRCLSNRSRSQEVGMCLGAQAGEERIRQVVASAGFNRFRRATETPFNIVYEARP